MAMGVAMMWASSALFFDFANRKLQPIYSNLIRMVFAIIPISILLYIISGNFLVMRASSEVWFWLVASGFIGFVFGDYFLFVSYKLIHATYTQVIMTLSPLFAAITGFILLNERLNVNVIMGMLITILGIAMAIIKKNNNEGESDKTFNLKISGKGILFALLSALGQGVGLVLSKKGIEVYHTVSAGSYSNFYISVAATEIRILTGVIGYAIIVLLAKNGISKFKKSFQYPKNVLASCGGAIVGLGIGVPLSLWALQYTKTAVVSTIIATVPILLLIYQKLFCKRKISTFEVIGVLFCVLGVFILVN